MLTGQCAGANLDTACRFDHSYNYNSDEVEFAGETKANHTLGSSFGTRIHLHIRGISVKLIR